MNTLKSGFAFAVLLLSSLPFGTSRASVATPEMRYAEAAKILAAGCEGAGCDFGIGDAPDEINALKTIWSATQDWTVAYLDAHPSITAERLQTELLNRNALGRDNIAPSDVFQLAPGLFAFMAQYDEMGNVFLARKNGGRFSIAWDIRQASEDARRFPILRAWLIDQARDECRTAGEASWANCGPLFGNEIRLLPPDGHGNPRFYLSATYAQAAETTVGGQLSIWTLDGSTPKIQWAKRYGYNFEDVSWRLDGKFLKIRTTDWWHIFFACGTCIGRQMNWTIRIHPDGIDDLGMLPVVPELDAIDELFYHVWKHKSVDALATTKVISTVAKIIADKQEEDTALAKKYKETVDPDYFSLGMLGGDPNAAVIHQGREVCLVTDDSGPILVKFEERSNKLFATDLIQFPQSETETCSNSSP